MTKTGRIGSALLAVALAGATLACGSDGDEQGEADGSTTTVEAQPQQGGKVVYGLSAETDGWNVASNRWTPAGLNVARAVYDPLAAFDAAGEPQPYLAESITSNDDFTEWTITLRDGVEFHDGSPLTGEVVAANLQAVYDSALIGPSMKVAETIEATGPLEVTVTMSEPWSSFPVLIAQQPGFIVHPDVLSGEVTDPIGTGPFVFAEWVPDDHFTAERNEDYWRTDAAGNQLPYLNEVEFRVLVEPSSREAALEAGDVDLMHTVSAEHLQQYGHDLQAPDGYDITYTPGSDDEQLISLNSQSGSTNNPNMRMALALAIDREALNDGLYEGYFELADAPYSEGSPWYSDPGWPEYDPDAAREMLDRVENKHVTLSAGNTTSSLQLAQAVAEQWEAVGVDVDIATKDAGTLTLDIVTGEYEAVILSLFNAPDPDGDYHFWDPTNITEPGEFSLAFTRYHNDELKAAMDAARTTNDDGERAEQYAIVWREVAENVPLIWLWHTTYVVVSRDTVHGLDAPTLPDGGEAQVVNWGSIFLTEAWVD
jgi:ABC-type transport system substrate-binding protein